MGQKLRLRTRKNGKAKGVAIRKTKHSYIIKRQYSSKKK